MFDTAEILTALTAANGVSGCENDAADRIETLLRSMNIGCEKTLGGVRAHLNGKSGSARVLLDAHIDQIGFRVTAITDDGFVLCDKCGGIDKRILAAQRVLIHGKKDISGVFCSTPPHLKSKETEIPEISDMYIDTGLQGDRLKQFVSVGDSISFNAPARRLLGTRIGSGALDNRCGAAAVLFALDILKEKEKIPDITAYFSSQEEIGERGAKIASFTENADYVIACDVSFALTSGEPKEKCGTLGGGVMIGVSPVLDRDLSQKAQNIALREKIKYTTEIMCECTSTNADAYQIGGSGAKCALLSVPIKYMHTPCEVCDIEDVEATGRLIAAFAEEIAGEKND